MSTAEETMNYKYNSLCYYVYDEGEKLFETMLQETITVTCKCGCSKMFINFIRYPFCGAYIKATCSACGVTSLLMDDFG